MFPGISPGTFGAELFGESHYVTEENPRLLMRGYLAILVPKKFPAVRQSCRPLPPAREPPGAGTPGPAR